MQLLEKKENVHKVSGVYLIECNSHKYVGSSNNIYARYKQHLNSLKRGSHYNIFLQRLYSKYNKYMTFKLIEACDNYIEREAYYIKTLESDVNVEMDPITRAKSQSTKEKLRMANKNKRLGSDNHVSVKVYQYTLEGIYLNEYVSIREASIAVNGNEQAIGDAAKGKSKSSSGFQWKREKFDSIPSISKRNRKPYSINKISISDGNKTVIVSSVKEAAILLGATEGAVRKAITHGFKCKKQVIKLEL